jgi:hypothetical protein
LAVNPKLCAGLMGPKHQYSTLLASTLIEYFIEKNTRGDGGIDRITAAKHGNANSEVGGFKELLGETMLFTSNQQCNRPSAAQGFVIQQPRW